MITEKMTALTNSLCVCEANVAEIEALDFYIAQEIEILLQNHSVAPYITNMAQRMFTLSSILGEKIKELKERIDKEIFPTVNLIEKDYENKTQNNEQGNFPI